MVELFNPYTAHLNALKDCALGVLEKYERPVGRAFIAPGAEVAWDDCCDGQLWVRAVTNFPSGRPFPSRDVSRSSCSPIMTAFQMEIGIMRCAHVIDDNMVAPTPAQLTGDANAVLDDMEMLKEAITCCFFTEDLVGLLDTWTPQGPSGGCVGGVWTLWLGQPQCACPE